MNEKKQIEEMAKVIKSSLDSLGCGKFNFTREEISTMFAKALYNADYRKQEWISVEERLPEEDGEYLTWNGLIYYLIWFNASLGLWNVSEDGDTSTAIRDVTHWMPLPEAPKMKGCAE